jgi:hypothetical protein
MTSDRNLQASVFSEKSDHCMTSSDALLEYEDPPLFVDPSDPPPDSDEPAFMDLFTESESSKGSENSVRDDLPPRHSSNQWSRTYPL